MNLKQHLLVLLKQALIIPIHDLICFPGCLEALGKPGTELTRARRYPKLRGGCPYIVDINSTYVLHNFNIIQYAKKKSTYVQHRINSMLAQFQHKFNIQLT